MNRLLRASTLLFGSLLAPGWAAADQASLIHHTIDSRLDPETRELEVTDVITLSGRAQVNFALAPWVEIERVRVNGSSVEPRGDNGQWQLDLPGRGRHDVEVQYAGKLPPLAPGGGPHRFHAGASGPDGAFLPGSARWIPETGDEWITYRLTIRVPAPYRAVATGRFEKELAGEATYRSAFVADYRARPPSLFVGPYTVAERQRAGIRIRTYFHPELKQLAAGYLDASERYLSRFQDEVGAYPFRDFHVISAPIPVGLGFPNLTYIGRRVLGLPFIRTSSLPHEVLHNWWGNGVAVDYATGNWSEGLTTYMADYALAADRGSAPAREMRFGWLRDFAALPQDRDMPVVHFTSKRHDAAQVIGYNKVAFIFHMLEREIGTPAFAESLRLFWERQRFRVADWSDLQAAFEVSSEQELDWFFDQWLSRKGAPQLTLGEVDAQGRLLNIALRQAAPAYKLTVPVVITTSAGEERHEIAMDETQELLRLEAKATPRAVHIDATYDLFRRLLPGEAPPILRDVTLASSPVTVIAARDEATAKVARLLADRLLDTGIRQDSANPGEPAPLLLIGTTAEVVAKLAEAGLNGVPESLGFRGTARVWTARQPDGQPLLAVAADNLAALEALLGPLPHYGRTSYLIFQGRQAIETGVWPASDSPLSHRFDG